MKVLVTGAAGFIGSHVVEDLLGAGHHVVGLDCFDTFYDPAVKEDNVAAAESWDAFQLVRGDIRDLECLAALPPDIDAVIHLAARAGVRPSIADPSLYVSVNVDGTTAILDWMRAEGVRHLLFASSSSVYGNNPKVPFSEDDPVDFPISPYAATKRSGELICHTYHLLFDLSVVALRFFTVYGPRQRPDLAIHKFATRLRDGQKIPMFGDGTMARDYTYIDDIVAGVRGALGYVQSNAPVFEIVNLGESQPVVLSDMIRILGEEMGVEPVIDQLPMQPGDVTKTFADVEKALRLFAYRPSTDFRAGIQRFLEWFRVA